MPSALLSCSATKALRPSGETAMYSGSQSMPGWRLLLPVLLLTTGVSAVKVGVATTLRVGMSMMLTLPTGSGAAYRPSDPRLGVPSLATSSRRPSGVKNRALERQSLRCGRWWRRSRSRSRCRFPGHGGGGFSRYSGRASTRKSSGARMRETSPS